MISRLFGVLLAFVATPVSLYAGSATWGSNPVTGDWNTAVNWNPATVPSRAGDVATFGVSSVTEVSLSQPVTVSGIVFNAGASAFQIKMPASPFFTPGGLSINGSGLTNNSAVIQTLTASTTDADNPEKVTFEKNASAGGGIVFDLIAEAGAYFLNNSTAAQATFIAHGGTAQSPGGGAIYLRDSATAGQASFEVDGGAGAGTFGGGVVFNDGSTAGSGTFVVNGSTANSGVASGTGGHIDFFDGSSAATGSFTCNGGAVAGADGGSINFYSFADAGSAILIVNRGQNGGIGGKLFLSSQSNAAGARVEVFGNGFIDAVSIAPGFSLGSLEGDGSVHLGFNTLTIGGNNLSTTFSGTIQNSGSLIKTGTGTLTLSGSNLYDGGTTINGGTFLVTNRTGSGVGTGAVVVASGTLGGSGIISGTITVNSGAFLAPAHGTRAQATLTIQSPLTFNSGATYTYSFKAKNNKAKTDKVIAEGVTINSGAGFSLSGIAQGILTQGLVLNVISNTAATPIAGTFSNLSNGAILTVGSNHLQASYSGGDGNDLTLTVVP